MKRGLVPIVCFVVVAAGVATFAIRYIDSSRPNLTVQATDANRAGQPKVEVVGPLVYEFGTMPQMQTNSHMWEVKNAGDFDLELWLKSSSFGATAKLAAPPEDPIGTRLRIKPNETKLIEVQWRTKQITNEYSATCTMGTNDPERPTFALKVAGIVAPKD
jgi:hypothetical protein